MKTNQIKILTIVAITFAIFAILTFQNNATRVHADNEATVAFYKKNCMMCHTATASKSFDTTKEDAVLEAIILDGKDAKPIKMPEYKSKGVDAAKAKELVAYMRAEKAKTTTPTNTNTQ